MMTTKFRCSGKAAWLWALAVFALAVPAIANIDGAIFTTTMDGTTVNGNIYASKAEVYLGGGPAKSEFERPARRHLLLPGNRPERRSFAIDRRHLVPGGASQWWPACGGGWKLPFTTRGRNVQSR